MLYVYLGIISGCSIGIVVLLNLILEQLIKLNEK